MPQRQTQIEMLMAVRQRPALKSTTIIFIQHKSAALECDEHLSKKAVINAFSHNHCLSRLTAWLLNYCFHRLLNSSQSSSLERGHFDLRTTY